MTYYKGTFLAGAHWFGVLFPKLETFFGIFWVLTINYSLYEKTILGIFVYLFLFKVTTIKVNFRFNSAFIWQHVLFANKPFFRKMLVPFFSSNIFLFIEKIPWKNYVKFGKLNLKCIPQSAQNSFSRKSNLKFCIIFNMISFANA